MAFIYPPCAHPQFVGSSPELGQWNADAAPNLKWGEGDVWAREVGLKPGRYELKVGPGSLFFIPVVWIPGQLHATRPES